MSEVKTYSALLCMGDASHFIDCVHVSDYDQLKAENKRLTESLRAEFSALRQQEAEIHALREQLDEAVELMTMAWEIINKQAMQLGGPANDLGAQRLALVDAWLEANGK